MRQCTEVHQSWPGRFQGFQTRRNRDGGGGESGSTDGEHAQKGQPTVSPQPNTSALNVNGRDVVPNLTTVKLGADGSINIFNNAGVVH